AGSQKVEILNKANGKTTAYYVAVAEDAPAPSREQIVAGQNNAGGAALAFGSVSLDANEEKSSVTAALGADSTHYDVYVVLHHIYIDDITGINYGKIYSEVVKLDVTTSPAALDPPTLQSAIVNAKGDVELAFDKAMTDPAGSAGEFMVCRDDGISRTVTTFKVKTGDTKTIELILTSKISGGQVFYVSYIPMADGKVEAVDGGVLAGFSPRLIENNLPHPVLDTDDPPTGMVGTPYSYTLTATGGTGSYSFNINDGCLPSGLVLDNNTGVLSGIPSTTGSYTFTIMAIDGDSAIDKHNYTLIINEASDTTPPAFAEGFPKAGATQVEGSRRVSLLVNPLETVDVYYVIIENSAVAPTIDEVIAGTGSGGSAAIKKGNFTSVNTEGIDISIILSDHNTDYDAYVVITDEVGNPTLGGPVDLGTPAPANIFVEGYPNAGDAQSAGSKKIEIVVKTVGDAQVFYVLVSDNDDAPSIDQIVNGKKSEHGYYLDAGNFYVTTGCVSERFVTNALPTDGTEYDIYVVARNIKDSTILSKSEKLDVITPPAAVSNVTTINVKSGCEAIVTGVDNNAGIESITVANGTTLGILMDAIESTDGSAQAYDLRRRDSYIVDADTMLLTNDILEVTAENDSIKKQYAITIAKVPITSISISGSGDASSVKKGRTLQMNVAVLPSNATDKTVIWSVENKTGNASITDKGLLTAISVGTVTVKAIANDGSDIEANKDITITAANGKTKQTGFFAILATEEGIVPPVIPPIEAGFPVMTDISNHWAKENIKYLVERGIIVGYPDNTFRPDNPITRAEFTALLVKALGLTADSGKVFEDTSKHWAKNYISTAAAYGIVLGYNDKGFGPDDVITREQMVVMIARAAHLSNVSDTPQFADSDHISSWAREAINGVAARQIITGYIDNTFRSGNLATRAEAVTILLRMKNM
ncbi:MAG: S-layer homology domain-containing protein, partial [Tepidanaerobacteraceae bacterium]|nr:S-layer homology domain-containing protein [Tepidanaerobacteraceae bacterium]